MAYEKNNEIIENMNQLNMEIDDSGFVYLNPDNWGSRNVCSPFSRLYLVSDGEGALRVGEKQIVLSPGFAYFIPAGLTFDYGCSDYLEKLYFHLRLVRPDGYDLTYGLPFVAKMPLEKAAFEEMRMHYCGKRWEDVLLLEQAIRMLVIGLLRQYDVLSKPFTTYSTMVEEAMQYIHSHLSAALTTKEVANALFLSEVTLARRFRQETGRTIHQYLEDMVFQAACKRLAVTDQPLGEISGELGFCDPFYFSRRFRQRYGEPPSKYQKKFQG